MAAEGTHTFSGLSKYLKKGAIVRGRPILRGKEAEIYARVVWEVLRREILAGLSPALVEGQRF